MITFKRTTMYTDVNITWMSEIQVRVFITYLKNKQTNKQKMATHLGLGLFHSPGLYFQFFSLFLINQHLLPNLTYIWYMQNYNKMYTYLLYTTSFFHLFFLYFLESDSTHTPESRLSCQFPLFWDLTKY